MRKARLPEPEGFADFWSVWQPHMRHTDGRGDARERFRKEILEGADPQDMIDGARAYIRNLLALPERERQFIPLAASWLHKQSYLDWCEKERAYQARIAERQEPTNVVQIANAKLPENHFSRRWERGEFKASGE